MYVGDDVWAELDPASGGISPCTVRRFFVAAAVVAVLAVGGTWAWDAGLLIPRLADPDDYGMVSPTEWGTRRAGTPGFYYDIDLVNHGDREVKLVGAGRSGPGLKLTAVQLETAQGWSGTEKTNPPPSLGFPHVLAPGASTGLRLYYAVTDCAAVSSGEWPVPVRAEQWWGEVTVSLRPRPETDDASSFSVSHDGRSAYSVEWQRHMADEVCLPSKEGS